jgi:hypothetical protein
MSAIYQEAQKVLVWLGCLADGSGAVMKIPVGKRDLFKGELAPPIPRQLPRSRIFEGSLQIVSARLLEQDLDHTRA